MDIGESKKEVIGMNSIAILRMKLNSGMSHRMMDFLFFLAKLLPKKLIYVSFIDVVAQVTTGKYSKTSVPNLTCIEAIDRYSKDNKICM